jgi:hypothetical protein
MTEAEQLAEARQRLAWVYHRSRNGLFSRKRSERDAALADINGWTSDYDMHWKPSESADPNSQWFGERP